MKVMNEIAHFNKELTNMSSAIKKRFNIKHKFINKNSSTSAEEDE